MGLFFMLDGGIALGGCGGVGGGVGVSVVLASILWFTVMYFCFHVHGGCWLSPRF